MKNIMPFTSQKAKRPFSQIYFLCRQSNSSFDIEKQYVSMKLTRAWKILIGILTVMQLFVGLFYVVWIFTVLLPELIAGHQEVVETLLLESIGGFIISMIVLIFLSISVMIFYIVHAAGNKHIGNGMKALWIVLIFFFGSIAEVAYFFMEIMPEKSMTARIEEG